MSGHRPKVYRGADGRWRFSCTSERLCLFRVPILAYSTHRGALYAANQHARRAHIEALVSAEQRGVMPDDQ